MKTIPILAIIILIFNKITLADWQTYCSDTTSCAGILNAVTAGTQTSLQRFYQDTFLRVNIYVNGTAQNFGYFFPTVDIYSLLQVNGSYDYFKNLTEVIEVGVEVNGFANEDQLPRTPYLPDDTTVVGYLVLVVTIANGNVISLQWDTDCSICPDPTQCVDGFCTNAKSDCEQSQNSTNVPPNCDLKIYLAWVGTDSNDQSCTSAGSLTSRLRQYSVDNVYDQTSDIITSLPDRIKPSNPSGPS